MNLLESLTALGNKINRYYPEINSGGCCIYAAIVGEELLARNIKTRIVIAHWCRTKVNIDYVRKSSNPSTMEDWTDNDIHFNHVGVEFKYRRTWYSHDTDITVKSREGRLGGFFLYPGRLTVDEAKTLASSEHGWNSTFDRNNIPRIRNHIHKFFISIM